MYVYNVCPLPLHFVLSVYNTKNKYLIFWLPFILHVSEQLFLRGVDLLRLRKVPLSLRCENVPFTQTGFRIILLTDFFCFHFYSFMSIVYFDVVR